jgi:hypothetical protein
MTIAKKRIIYSLSGILGALGAFAAVQAVLIRGPSSFAAANLLQGLSLGAVFGLMFGLDEGFLYASVIKPAFSRYIPRALLRGALGGAAGILAVLLSAQLLLLTGVSVSGSGDRSSLALLGLVRGSAWFIPGAAIGSLDGILRRSGRRALVGALGGLVGGLAGGIILELLTLLLPGSVGGPIAGFLAFGLSIGLFLGIFEERFAYGRIRVLSGEIRNREYLLSDRVTGLGRAGSDQIRLDEYDGVQARHAAIERRGADMLLILPGDAAVLVNDENATQRQVLKYGDVIRLGDAKLLLRTR